MILHENRHRIVMIREDKVRRSCVKVTSPGYTHRVYRFNNIPFYEHPLLSWANLDCCGGWAYDKDYLLTAVQDGKKPVADIVEAMLPEVSPSPSVDVWYDPEPVWNGMKLMIIARHGCIADFFDLDEIVEAYKKQDVRIERAALEPYAHTPLIELFQEEFWTAPRTREEWIITGLGLGYPIESTASILCGH